MCRTYSLRELLETYSRVEDVFTGVVHAQSEGQGSTRPLSKRKLYAALRSCSVIATETVAMALARVSVEAPSKATVGRYTAIARIASRAIDDLLEVNPHWFQEDLCDEDAALWAPEHKTSEQLH